VKIIRSGKHQHYSGVFSIGLQHATRQIVFFISNDMFVTPTFIESLLLVSALSPEIGIVRGTSNYTDSHLEHRVEPKQKPQTYQDVENFSRNVFAATGARFVEDQVLSGDAILLKRSVIDRIGVLDLRFFGYFGDMDYGIRARQAGFRLVCAKGAWLFHEGSGHVKREATVHGLTMEEISRRRMALVEDAYQEFRKKWNIAVPDSWGSGATVDPYRLLDQANAHSHAVPLKYEFPDSVLSDLEFH
jgi:GT2 family glycosyltransferase